MLFEADWVDPNTSFDRAFAIVQGLVQRAYDRGQPDKFFRGKWYAHFVCADVQQSAHKRHWNRNGFHDRLLSCLMMSFDTRCEWARRVCGQIEDILDILD